MVFQILQILFSFLSGPNLRIVSTMSVGYEHIDLEACRTRGIAVTNTPNVSTDSVSELTVSLLLLVARRLYESTQKFWCRRLSGEVQPVVVFLYYLSRILFPVRLIFQI